MFPTCDEYPTNEEIEEYKNSDIKYWNKIYEIAKEMFDNKLGEFTIDW
jgi:hypothetical protein